MLVSIRGIVSTSCKEEAEGDRGVGVFMEQYGNACIDTGVFGSILDTVFIK